MSEKNQYTKIRIDAVSKPFAGMQECITESYWAVTPDDCILFYSNAMQPQCNKNESIARRIVGKLHPECEVRYLAAVYIPIRVGSDWRRVITKEMTI